MVQETKNLNLTKKLSILVAQDGLYFCISTPDGVIQHFYEQEFSSPQGPENLLREIRSFFTYSMEKNVKAAIAEIRVMYAHPLFTLVPDPYFSKDKLSDYLKFNVKLLPTDELACDAVETLKAKLIYVPFTNINNYLFEKFGEFTYGHVLTHYIEQCFSENQSKEGTQAYINGFTTHFDLCIFQNGELLLCNSYNYFSPEDFLYYVLFTFEQLHLDPETLKLNLSGAIEKDSKIFDLLFKYVRKLSFVSQKGDKKIEAAVLKDKPDHVHQLLLNTI